jgi:hypothetical protein
VEGEFDALLTWQAAGDLVGVATLGSCAAQLPGRALRFLIRARRLLVAYDSDAAGQAGARRLMAASPGLPWVPVRLPAKDVTTFHQAGGDIRAWVQDALGGAR